MPDAKTELKDLPAGAATMTSAGIFSTAAAKVTHIEGVGVAASAAPLKTILVPGKVNPKAFFDSAKGI